MTEPRIQAGGRAPEGWLSGAVAYPLILLFALALYLPGLATLPAVDRDEARFAESSRQMLESGDYIDIRLQNAERLKKPVGIYWLQAAATALAGGEDPANPIWTYRLPSFAGALGAVLLTLAIGRRWLGGAAGLYAAALLATSLLLNVEARQATTDAALSFLTLAALAGLADAWMAAPNAEPGARWTWIAFWIAIGAGILVKGPIILLVVGLCAAALVLLDRRRAAWLKRLRPWPGVLIAAAITAPWLVAITIRTHGAFWVESIGTDMAAKLAGARESHGAPSGTYLALFPLTFWPGSLFALFALPWVWRNRRDRAVLFCIAWVAPSWIVFEAVPTKLPHYVLPLYPAIALLAGAFLADRLQPPDRSQRWPTYVAGGATALWMVAGAALAIAAFAAAPLADGRPSIRGIGAGLALLGTTMGGAYLAWRGQRLRALGAVLGGSAVGWALVFGAALPALEAPWIAPRLRELLFEKSPAGYGPMFIAGYTEPSALITFGADTRFGGGADAAHWLAESPGAVAIVGGDQAESFTGAVAENHVAVEALGSVTGFNYSKGRRLTLTLYRRALP